MLRGEQRIHSVLFVEVTREDPDATIAREDLSRVFGPLERAAARYGGRVVPLGSVAAALSLEARTSPADRARQAVATANELLASEPGARVAIATGRAETLSGRPAGPVIERASRMLVTSAPPGTILLDETTRGLLGGQHDKLETGEFYRLSRAPAEADEQPLLLGKRTPFVGRTRELGVIESASNEAFEESHARVTVIVAPPGLGKSRLVREVVARRREADAGHVVGARCEIVARASPLSLARAIVRAAAGVSDVDAGRSAERLRAHLTTLGEEAVARADFLLEMAGLPVSHPGPELVAARNEPLAMREGLRAAFELFLDRECAARPLMLVLEDIHWSDSPSLALLVSALRRSADRPLFVLATARPELDEEHPSFVRDCQAEVLRIGAMARRHREELVRAVLGDKATEDVVARITALSDGNAFYLEELIRCANEGTAAALPESIVAMAQVRLSAQDDEARSVLRAASIYRGAVTPEGVAAVLGAADVASIARELASLANDEVLARREPGAGAGQSYAFRHALLEAAAYGMVPADDREAGHLRAAEWLETQPSIDPAVVADHYQRGGDDPRALPFIARAARAFVEADQMDAALELTARGLSLGATGETRGVLLVVRGLVLGLKGEWAAAARDATEGMSLLAPGSPMWFRSAGTVVFADAASGRSDGAVAVLGAILALDHPPEPTGPFGRACTVLITGLLLLGQGELATQLLARMTGAVRDDQDPSFSVWIQTASSHVALLTRGAVGAALAHARRAVLLSTGAVDPIAKVMANLALARTSTEIGRTDDALAACERAAALTEALGTSYLRDWVRVLRGGALGMGGRFDEGAATVAPNVEHDNLAVRGLSLMTVARAELEAGRLDDAEKTLERANRGGTLPLIETISLFHSARLALARGQLDLALQRIERHLAGHARAGHLFGDIVAANELRARVLGAMGRTDEARAGMAETIAKIDAVAAEIPDAADVEAFLSSAPCREARALALSLGL
jgi:tetratricopeptide (TPR) repeat protein